MTSVLFVRLSAMGDLVQGLGAIRALHQAQPDWRLAVVTQAEYLPLLAGLPGLQMVLPFARRGGLRAIFALRAQLRACRFDAALDLQGNWKSALITRLSGAAQLLGAAGAWRQEPLSRVLLQRNLPVPGHNHPALVAHSLARALVPELPFCWPQLAASASECEHEAAELRRLGIEPTRPFLLLVVTDPADPRALRPAVVAAELAAAQLPAVVLLGPAEAKLVPPAGAAVLRHAAGELRRLVALGALLARNGGVVYGPDQGASHVLAAAGAHCVVSFGAQDPRRTAPPAASPVRHPEPPVCSPCRQRSCTHPDGPVCMEFRPLQGRPWPQELPPPAQ